MIRSLSLAALLAAGLAMPAMANEEAASDPATDAAAVSAHTAQLTQAAQADQVRKMLSAQGYNNISALTLNDYGRWTGSAEKGGKVLGVSVILPSKLEAAPSTN